jgi:uncharacterized protein YndB with AHSA1/START domain
MTTTVDEISITRVLDAPVEKVWQVWTEPEHFAAWFNASPQSVALDLRPGGAWHADITIPGGVMPMGGVYREVVEYERIVWTLDVPDGPVVMTATFAGHGAQTEATYHQNVLQPYSCQDAKAGAEQIIENFATYLATA